MPRGPGRDPGVAMQRLVRILTALAAAAPGWVNRDRLLAELDYGGGPIDSRRDAMARDIRHLRDLGWGIQSADQGEHMRHRRLGQDPRLRTLLTPGQIRQLARAVTLSGRDASALGLPDPATDSPQAPLLPANPELELEEILHALHHRCLLSITYKGSHRDVHVDDVRRTSTGRWLIIGREAQDSAEQKSYRLDRLSDLRVGPPRSASPRQPVDKDPNPLTIVDSEQIDAVVSTTPQHEQQVVRELGSPTARSQSDTDITLTIPVVNRWLWRMRLYHLGTRVRLLAPEELRAEVRNELLAFVPELR